jgi:glutamyl-tRNA reductase
VVVIGLSHRGVDLDLLGRMTVPDTDVVKALTDLSSRPNIGEAVVLSTCNRVEVYVLAERFHGAYDDVREFFSTWSHLPPERFADALYVHYDLDCARHLFEVTAGLDSAVVGEAEVLGQVRKAWERGGHGRRATRIVRRPSHPCVGRRGDGQWHGSFAGRKWCG